MNNLQTRAVFGAIFVAVLVFGILFSSWSIVLLFLIISLLGLHEFYTITGIKKHKLLSVGLGGLVYLVNAKIIDIPVSTAILVSSIGGVFLLLELFSVEGAFSKAALRITGLIYIIIPFSLVNQFHQDIRTNAWLVLGMFILVWTNDTGAYLSGRSFGKTKLFERISPNKTIEGLVGGGILTIIASIIIAVTKGDGLLQWVLMALVVFAFANMGDLVESMLKRNHGIKDSGNIIPGHGGILDRFDGVLLTIPMIYLLLTIISNT